MSDVDAQMQNVIIQSLTEYCANLTETNKKQQKEIENLQMIIRQIAENNECEMVKEKQLIRVERDLNSKLQKENEVLKKLLEEKSKNEFKSTTSFCRPAPAPAPEPSRTEAHAQAPVPVQELATFASDFESPFHANGRFPHSVWTSSSNTKESIA